MTSDLRKFGGVIALMLSIMQMAFSQRISSELDFRNPVDIPIRLSGNFGEFRSNHFHTGIDIKTNGKTGIPVYAIEEGWVRRIKTGPFSYGKVLYVDHPSGHTSVYAHLSDYNDTISSFLCEAQKILLRNEVDVFPNKDRIPVAKGELIGFTGNTGRSGGPHLHFEVRTADTEKPLNPLLLGFEVEDRVPPSVNGILVESFGDSLRGKVCHQKRYYAKGSATNKTISGVVNLTGHCGISVHALDYLSGASNPCGVYSIQMKLDEELVYEMKLDSLDFSTGRYINAHKNYEVFKKEKSSFHRCFIQPNNPLDIYSKELDGILRLKDDLIHEVTIQVTDAVGNQTFLEFKVQRTEEACGSHVVEKYLKFDEANSLEHEKCTLRIPPRRLVNDEVISITEYTGPKNLYAGFFKVGDETIPLQNKCLLSIKIDSLYGVDSTKFFISRYDPKNGRYYTQGGEYKDGWVRTRVKQFGIYTISHDSTAPVVDWKASVSPKTRNVRIKITDDHSGIHSYSMTVNGTWIPLYYNYKSARLEGKLEEELLFESTLHYKIEVSDERRNVTIKEGELRIL